MKDVYTLQKMKDIHLYSDLQYEIQLTGNGKNIWILFGISLLILLLAWVNHFNIFTTSAIDQSKALGIRKIVGASRRQLISQLSVETLLYSILALVFGLVLIASVEPLIKQHFDISLAKISFQQVSWDSPVSFFILLIILGIVVGSLIPALALSAIKPVHVISNRFSIPSSGVNLRKLLSTLQFTIIIALLISTFIVHQQTNYMQQQDLGIAVDNMLIVRGPLGTQHYENLAPYYERFRNQIEAFPEVVSLAESREIPGNSLEMVYDLKLTGQEQSYAFNRNVVSGNWFERYQLPFLSGGRAGNFETWNDKIVINEAALNLLGYKNPEEVLHKKMNYYDREEEIIGVVKNHHQRSFHHPIVPIVFNITQDPMEDSYFSIQLSGKNKATALKKIEKVYKATFPHTVFEYFDLPEHLRTQYQDDLDFRSLNIGFTLLAVFIACMGLFGLSILLIKKRVKEIGIRKILGASVANIVTLLSKDFLKIVLVALLLAVPLSWYLMDRWLTNFTYRIELQWWVFVLAGILALGIAFLTVSIQSFKAALANPVEALRQE